MKFPKHLQLMFILLLFASIIYAQQAEKTLVKSFNLQGNQIVYLGLNGPVEVQTWKNETLRIQMTIALNNGSDAMLKSLIKAGRYNLKGGEKEDQFFINAPGLERIVKVKGEELQEGISFLVYAPENVLVKLADEASTSNTKEKNTAPF